MLAVLGTWARIFIPVVLIFVITGLGPFISRATYQANLTASIFFNLMMNISSFDSDRYLGDSMLTIVMINLGGPLYLVGAVTAPIAWGFWLATRFRFSSAGYFFSFMAYYLALGGILQASYVAYLTHSTRASASMWGAIDAYTFFMIGMSFPIITWLCFYTTCDILRRRS